jgi:hypothetical protein
MLWIIWFRTFHVPWWDEWAMVPILQHAEAGTLSFNDLWALHYDTHRILLPRTVQLALIEATRWNRQALMTFDLGVAAVTAWLLFSSVRRTVHSRRTLLALIIPLSLLYFSLSQYENWFGPWQIAFILTTFGVVCCLRGLHDQHGNLGGWRGFALAVCGALIASLSTLAGLVAWIAFLPSVARPRSQRALRVGLWVGSAAAIIVPYMIGFPHQAGQDSIYHVAGYAVTVLGAPIGYPNWIVSKYIGLLGLALMVIAVYAYWRLYHSLDGIIIWLCLALYALATAGVIAIGRAYDTSEAVTSRYQEYTCLWWIALVVIGAVCIERLLRAHRRVKGLPPARLVLGGSGITLALLLGLCLLGNIAGYRVALAWQEGLRAPERCVLDANPTPDCLNRYFIGVGDLVPGTSQDLIAYIRREHLAIFAR